MNVIAGLSLALGCFAVFTAALAWRINPHSWSNRWFGLALLSYAFWAFWSAIAVVAPDSGTFWFSYRMVILGSTALHPLGLAVAITALGVKGRWTGVLVLVSTALAVFVLILSATGNVVIEDYRSGPWGNVGIPTTDPLRFGLLFLSSAFASLGELVIVVWSGVVSSSRRLRSASLAFVILGGLANVLSYLTVKVLWIDGGYPDITVFSGIPLLALYWILISRHRYLRDTPPGLDEGFFRSLDESLFLLDPEGRILEASPRIARILGHTEGSFRHRPLVEVLPGWPKLEETLADLKRDLQPRERLEGTLAGQRYTLSLEPRIDRFGDLASVLVRLESGQDWEEWLVKFGLSDREKEVGILLIDGLSGPEIARNLGISPATVKNHLHSLFQKTATANRVELVRTLLRPSPEAQS